MRSEKLVWSRLCDDISVQEYGTIRTEDLCHSDPDIMVATSHNKVQLLMSQSVGLTFDNKRELDLSVQIFSTKLIINLLPITNFHNNFL